MRRNRSKAPFNSTHNAHKRAEFDAQAEIAALKTRIARLEARLVDDDDCEIVVGVDTDILVKRRRPQTKHSPAIYQDRDMFVRFFEQNWPEIEPLCGPKPKTRALRSILSSFSTQQFGQLGETAQKLLDRFDFLEEFLTLPKLRSRFRDDPRVLAGALAGVPDVGLWRSLKLCPPKTCKVSMNERAMRSYLKRKHPDVHQRLSASVDLIHVTGWWQEYRTRDKLIKGYRAIDIIRAWNEVSNSPNPATIRKRIETAVGWGNAKSGR
jgi:hypothetical protein